ncbi:unnamed protein product, partial [Aureobasidium vineae]
RRQSALIKQACDACKLRKVKCIYDDSNQPAGATRRPCQRCSRLTFECTFAVPQRCRGPRKRATGISNNEIGTPAAGPSSTTEDDSGVWSSTATQPLLVDLSDSPRFARPRTSTSSSQPAQSRNLSFLLNTDGISPTTLLLPTIPIPHSQDDANNTTTTPLGQRLYETDSICS